MHYQTTPAVGRLGVIAAALVELLRQGKPGDTITDEALESACGKPTGSQKSGYPALQSAINYVRCNHGLVWQRIPKAAAIRCLNADETVTTVGSDLRAIRKKTRRTVSKLETVDVAKIEDGETKKKATVYAAMFGALRAMASGDTVKKLEVRDENVKTPSVTDVLAMFKR